MKAKLMGIGLATLVLVLFLPAGASAFSTTCTSPDVLIPDGRLSDTVSVVNGTTQTVVFYGVAGRSYAFESHEESGGFGTISGTFLGYTIQNAADTCGGASTLTVVDRSDVEPRGTANFKRVTFIAPATNFYRISMNNGDTVPHDIKVSVAETTMFSPRWSTFGGFYTTWGIQNTTSASCSITLTVKTQGGVNVGGTPITFSVAAGAITFRDTRPTDLNVAAGQAGQVFLAHNCPAGTIQVDAFLENDNTNPLDIIPEKFEAVRQAVH